MTLKLPHSSSVGVQATGKVRSATKVVTRKPALSFQWPLRRVATYRHDGINGVRSIGIIITGTAGAPVISAAHGTVKKVGWMRGFGNYIVINHPGRFATVYARLGEISVSEGEPIKAGNVIGRIGMNENDIHFQIDCEGKPEDPLKYLP